MPPKETPGKITTADGQPFLTTSVTLEPEPWRRAMSCHVGECVSIQCSISPELAKQMEREQEEAKRLFERIRLALCKALKEALDDF